MGNDSDKGIDSAIDAAIEPVSDFLASIVFYAVPLAGQDIYLVLLWLVAASLFFTFYLGFVNIRYFGHGIALLRGKYDRPAAAAAAAGAQPEGQINRFQALSTSLSGTVGLGNIAGVAVAVSTGGPGAVFWMILMGFFGMSSKFAEAALGVKYRHHHDPAHPEKISGGPMYYLRDAFSNRGIPALGWGLAAFFCVCCIGGTLGAGNMFQANQSYQQVLNVTGGQDSFLAGRGWLFGLFLALMVGLVIIGGLKSIASVASRIVPFMGGLYLLAGLVVIAVNYQAVPEGLLTILRMALTPEAGFGGFVGALLMGVQRAAFSNEAGIGSAAIVHATAKTDQPVSQGFVAMLGPFVDTIVICLVTALVIVISGVYTLDGNMQGVALTSRAFETVVPWFRYVLAMAVLLFAFSTMISWSYYGLKSATYLLGEKQWVEVGYKILFCLCVIVGASSELGSVISFSDSMVFAMAIPNIIALYVLAPELKRDLNKYLQSIQNKEEKT